MKIEDVVVEDKFTRNEDGSYDVEGNVDLRDLELTEIPFKFGVVTGYFDCSDNNLQTLDGAPEKVDGDFLCNNNKLETLDGAPQKVGGAFWCWNNHAKFAKEDVEKVSKVKGDILV